MKLSKLHPSKYLKAADLDGDLVVEIDKVRMEKFDNEPQPKPVISFYDQDQELVLNKTNASIIGSIYGEETDNWGGRKITLYAERVPFQGKLVDAVRVRPTKPAPAADGVPI